MHLPYAGDVRGEREADETKGPVVDNVRVIVMLFLTTSGSSYEIINRENIEKNGVFIFKYVLMGSVDPQYVRADPKPRILDYAQVKTDPQTFNVGDHIVFYLKDQYGHVNRRKIHITAAIKKIRNRPSLK